MNGLNIGLLYLALHNQLVKKFGVNAIISNKDFFMKVGRHSQVPKNLRYLIIKEMEEKELIKKVNRDNIQILDINLDMEKEEDCHQIYKLAGIF